MWDDNQKELPNLYAQKHQFSPRLFKNFALPWKDDKDSYIPSSEETALRKSILQPLPGFSVLNHGIYISFNDLENLMYKEEWVGLCCLCCIRLYTWSQRGLFLKKTKGKVMFTWVFFTLEVYIISSVLEILLIPNSTIGISIMDFHEQKWLWESFGCHFSNTDKQVWLHVFQQEVYNLSVLLKCIYI